jgi:hypothetical protein
LVRITTPELWTKKENPERNFFVGNGISQFVDHESPLSIGLQTAPWPPKFKPVSLPKYNGFRNSRQFLMRYESATTALSLQLGRPQNKIHGSISYVP